MGSGSGGAGGGGGGGGSSGGSGYSMRSGVGGPRMVSRSTDTIGEAFDVLLAGPPQEYYMDIFASDLARDLYEAIRDVAIALCLNKSWQAIEDNYQVSAAPGCLMRLKDAMVLRHGGDATDPRVREICHEALESLFIYAMGNRPAVYSRADAATVFQKVNRKVLIDSRSSYFLREMINEVAKRQSAELPPELRNKLHEYSLVRSDRIVKGFVERFKESDPEMTHNKIFHVIREHPDWFLSLFKKRES